MEAVTLQSKGILNPKTAEKKFHLTRYLPTSDLAYFVNRYWIIHWDLSDPYVQETLSNPCINLVFEKNNTRVWGVYNGKFARCLEGQGQVFAVQFRAGAFYPFVKWPISRLTDTSMPFREAFGFESDVLEAAMLTLDDVQMVEVVETFLRERLPKRDPNVERINQIVDCITADRKILKVDDVVARFSLNKRSLQRLFSKYVGISPKWVIQRCRLQEAAEQLAANGVSDYSAIALALGYFDQAHFINDFKMIIGTTPAEYAKRSVQS